jgi:methyl-accepting chemotaxis protein
MANQSISEAYIATLRAVLTENAEERDAYIQTVADRSARTTSRLEAYGVLPQSDDEGRRFARLLEARKTYFATRDKVLSALRNGQREAAQHLTQTDLLSDFSAYDQLSTKMLEAHAATLRAGADSVANSASVLQVLSGSISAALFLIAFILGLFVGLLLVPFSSDPS